MRKYIVVLWVCLIVLALYGYLFAYDTLELVLRSVLSVSLVLGALVLLALGCLRGLTLIPITYLIVVGLIFFEPMVLFPIIMIGALVSSATVYYFAEYLGFDALLIRRYPEATRRVRTLLSKRELPIITAWSAAPFLPTDVICYVAGTLRINIWKLLLGVFLGETVTSGIYIFLGGYLAHRYGFTFY